MTVSIIVALAALPAVSASAIDPESCTPRLISSAAGEDHVLFDGVAPDGRTLAIGWQKGQGPEVERGAFLLDLRTGKRTPLSQLNNAPSFSPDGRHLVAANYAADRALKTEIVELDRASGAARTYASGPSGEWLASYSRDGRWILFNSTRSGGSDLYRVKRSGGRVEQLSRDPNYEAHAQELPGGKLLFHRQVAGDNYDIALLDPATGRSVAIGATELEEAYPAMSPDGRWIAFSAVAAAGEQPNLYVMRRDGTNRRRLTRGAAKDAYAAWAPNGRALYFVRFSSEGSAVHRISMRSGECRK